MTQLANNFLAVADRDLRAFSEASQAAEGRPTRFTAIGRVSRGFAFSAVACLGAIGIFTRYDLANVFMLGSDTTDYSLPTPEYMAAVLTTIEAENDADEANATGTTTGTTNAPAVAGEQASASK